jgi:hypothetical protein
VDETKDRKEIESKKEEDNNAEAEKTFSWCLRPKRVVRNATDIEIKLIRTGDELQFSCVWTDDTVESLGSYERDEEDCEYSVTLKVSRSLL